MYELIHSMHITPKAMLPRKPVFNFRAPQTTNPAEWREKLKPFLDDTSDDLDRMCIDRVMKIVELINECGAIDIIVQMRRDPQYPSDKWLEFEAIFENLSDEMNFSRRLSEIE